MLKRAFFSTALAALLAAGTVPAGDACALSTDNDHPCCSKSRPQEVSSCCSRIEAPATVSRVGHGVHCNCVHVPETPATAAASGDTNLPNTHAWSADTAAVLAGTGPRSAPETAVVASVRSHPPPPAFLLDCAFLT